MLQTDGRREVHAVAEAILGRAGVIEREEILRRPRDVLVAEAIGAQWIESA